MPKIISLEEVESNRWVAKYRGNYGTYTIRLTVTADGKATDFHCTCPSGGYPCKHIGMILDAIPEHIAKQKAAAKAGKADVLSPAKLLAEVTEEELRAFIIAQAAKNAALRKAVLLEFVHKAKPKTVSNPYSQIIREGLEQIDLEDGYDDWRYHETGISLDILDEMFDKAAASIKNGKYDEAAFIAKACLEEYVEWVNDNGNSVADLVSYGYTERPFEILRSIAEEGGCNADLLYDYCKAKLNDAKFSKVDMQSCFHGLMLALAIRTNNQDFITVQEKLLADVPNTQSDYAERILSREIEFYRGTGEHGKADAILLANVHIDIFRIKVVDNLIAAHNYDEAKALIGRYPSEEKWRDRTWDERLLAIATAEHDTPKIREYVWRFIEDRFDQKHYQIYKSTFSATEWTTERERILNHYVQKEGRYHGDSHFSSSNTADVLAEENLAERLLSMMEKKPSPSSVEYYYKHFAKLFPERTLALFRTAVDSYVAANVGGGHYYGIAEWLGMIRKLPGGTAVCNAMLADYRLTYKRRTSMIKILDEKFG